MITIYRIKQLAAALCFFVYFISLLHAEPVKPSGYAVASAHPLATNAGLEILAKGGNAFDAAVAVSAVLAVVAPYHSGLGGGGFWLLHDAKQHKNLFIDGREVAPKAATRDMFLDKDGNPVTDLSLNGGLAAAIPGEPAALVFIAKHFGRLPLRDSLAPAIHLAEEGFPVDPLFHSFSTMGDRRQQLLRFPASAQVFLQNGKPYPIGARLIQRDLAHTLRLLASKGHDGFYRGKVAEQLVTGVNSFGGIWTLDDLASYRVKVREPLEGNYHNMHIVTAPLPSAGGIGLLTMLNILKVYPLGTYTKVQRIHYIVEAMRLAYWQRATHLGDADFSSIPVQQLLSADNAKFLRSLIKADAAIPSSSLPASNIPTNPKPNTTHFSILDQEGNRVAATLTVNFIFGSSIVAAGTGVLLNDEMDDFAVKPNARNVFGLIGNEKNSIEPGKRPLSSMTPTFLEMPDRIAILGTPGGSRIPTMILLAALAFHDSFGAITMVSKMRFHHQYVPDQLVFEPDTFSAKMRKQLIQMGYNLLELPQYFGDMQAISWDMGTQFIAAASDPRHIGLAAIVMNENKNNYGVGH
ncbi:MULTISPECIES: gamma-glutamyltransferase [Legionella]|uniref:Glutathione hydrolase proenzyme n=1 Tax=Legionella septentrionalis TaxID=2498109 RepID=A0A3S0XUB7_9GAMM|nr:gamma-glutamyltransferase [Legionella sp. 27cVA30]RUQ90395.1 gamma-glutamyltransferase [Legionella septentrionalis]MCP0913943.1 gamma-glutamyltransferase [Legionella sp. 27cVA30]RUR00046.1 gamma-glutamyltransferase [Legionella septentrionalis]RUR10742.1 gamma-glutamyltransferase [Legionella septentrionalis]RUR16505.1 gamma-glutamyltransferase [Legionella septentrionalis]